MANGAQRTADVELSLATETYNLTEGQSWDSFVAAMTSVARLVERTPQSEGLLLDVTDDPRIEALVAGTQGRVRRVACPGMNYDELKDRAADEAAGRYIAYLDGDCVPADDDWLTQLLAPLREGTASAVAGLTFYPGDNPLTHACNVLDFGFLLDKPGGSVGCYASNNVAFTTSIRREHRTPKTVMRCACYAHAQRLADAGHPMLSVPLARVSHEQPPIRRERFRRGYDLVATCWIHPALPETPLLEQADAKQFITENLMLDATRLDRYVAHHGLPREERDAIAATIRRLRRLDAYGVRAALRDGEATGANRRALRAHDTISAA